MSVVVASVTTSVGGRVGLLCGSGRSGVASVAGLADAGGVLGVASTAGWCMELTTKSGVQSDNNVGRHRLGVWLLRWLCWSDRLAGDPAPRSPVSLASDAVAVLPPIAVE